MCKARWHKFALAAGSGEVMVKLTMGKDKDGNAGTKPFRNLSVVRPPLMLVT